MSGVWRVRFFILFLAVIAGAMGYVYFTQRLSPEEKRRLEQVATQQSPTPTPEPAPELLNFAQIIALPYDLDKSSSASEAAVLSFISEHKPGFVVLFGSNLSKETVTEAVSEVVSEVDATERPLIAVDHEGGRVQRLNGTGFTKLPTWKRLCEMRTEQRAAYLASSAAELKEVGAEIVFAPVVDVAANNVVLKDRVCDDDSTVVSSAALEFIEIFQQQQIFSVIKHYPGIGSATLDTHEQSASVLIEEKDTIPFKAVLDTFPSAGVMTAHVGVENQNANVPCSLSMACVSQIFDLYPDAVVFTDALEMAAARFNPTYPDTPKSLPQVAYEAIMAGNTVLVFGQGVTPEELNEVLTRMRQEYTSSSEFRLRVNEAVKKVQQVRRSYITENSESEL